MMILLPPKATLLLLLTILLPALVLILFDVVLFGDLGDRGGDMTANGDDGRGETRCTTSVSRYDL